MKVVKRVEMSGGAYINVTNEFTDALQNDALLVNSDNYDIAAIQFEKLLQCVADEAFKLGMAQND